MNEQEVRALVREAIERHLGRPGASGATKVAPYEGLQTSEEVTRRDAARSDAARRARLQSSLPHASHILLPVLSGSDVDDGTCVIEPAVRCTHCGFCQSYGH